MASSLSPEQGGQIRRLFDAAVVLEPNERADYLDQACGDDPRLRQEVEALLAAHRHVDAVLAPYEQVLKGPRAEAAEEASPPDPHGLIGQTVSHYQIQAYLGGGGMGVVYRAEDTRLLRSVALKFLPPELIRDVEARERFVREARAASVLDHENICTVYEIVEAEQGQTFIAMACIEGETLKAKIARGPLSVAVSVDYALQMAEGLSRAHEAGIVHRDLKPANVMLTDRGQVKIVDFGLAKMADVSLTKEGTTLGTISYMSPEQARGESVDHRSDLWSLGVVLYEMLSGERPFRGDYSEAVIYSVMNEAPRPLATLRPEVPDVVAQVVEKLLKKDPDERYQDAEQLIADLRVLSRAFETPGLMKLSLPPARTPTRRAVLYGSAFTLLLLLALAFVGRTWRTHVSEPVEMSASIAVLPLDNLSGDASQEYFSDGMTIQLISDLGKIGALRVTSIKSAMRYKGTDKPLDEIALELGVNHVVVGSVMQAEGQVRITVQLVEAETDRQVWSDSFLRELRDVLVLQGQVAYMIAEQIHVRLSPREQALLASARPVNPEAHDAYLKGMFHWYKLTASDLENAQRYFELALEKDPAYALAHAGIALVWIGRMQQGYVPASEAGPRSMAAAEKALALDSTLAEVQFALAIVRTWGTWEWEEAERAFLQAIALNPNYPDARFYYSHLLHFMRRPQEAMVQIERALTLDPFNSLFQALYGMALNYVHRYDDARTHLYTILGTSPNDPVVRSALRTTLHMLGLYEEALEEWRALYAARGDREAEEALARGYAEDGYRGAMLRIAETMVQRSRTTYVTPWQIGTLYTRAGNADNALEWLAKAYEAHDPNMPYLSVDPLFDGLRDDLRFQALLAKMGLGE